MAERVVALATLIGGVLFLTQAWALPFGAMQRPGAGFFPVVIAAFACLVGVVGAVRAFLGLTGGPVPLPPDPPSRAAAPPPPPFPALEAERRGRVLTSIVLLIVFCALLPWVGYPIVAFAFVAVLLRRLGASWRAALIIGVLSAGLSYYVFAVLLDVPLPRGPW